MASYQDRLKLHLGQYKSSHLDVAENGLWSRNRQAYPHILPSEKWDLNLIETYRAEIAGYLKNHPEIKLHPDFHHLNSSQAMSLNLFYPFFADANPPGVSFLSALGLSTSAVDTWHFEYVADRREGTNFDFYARDSTGVQTYCEVKFSESGFGGAKPDQPHIEKRDSIYVPRLRGVVSTEVLESEQFFANYQVLRNISYVSDDERSRVVFLLPRANATLATLEPFLADHVASEMWPRIRIVYLEDLVQTLIETNSTSPERLRRHLELFAQKYLLEEQQ